MKIMIGVRVFTANAYCVFLAYDFTANAYFNQILPLTLTVFFSLMILQLFSSSIINNPVLWNEYEKIDTMLFSDAMKIMIGYYGFYTFHLVFMAFYSSLLLLF